MTAAPCGRYAPSPTGPLHLGNLRTALVAWLQARLAGARFVLRIEDLDRPRCRPGAAEDLIRDLEWLGLDWDEGPGVGGPHAPYEQSARGDGYDAAFERLRDAGRVFPCYCSRKDIAEAASAPHRRSAAYPGTCRDRPPRASSKGPPAWRFRVDGAPVSFDDAVLGRRSEVLERTCGDFVLLRRDGIPAYQLAVVVDDAAMRVTDVVRGADLLDSTARQIALFRALGHAVPRFWHVPLLRDASGRRLSKRDGSESLETVDRRCPERVVGRLAASLGLVPEGVAVRTRELVEGLTVDGLRDALRRG